MDAGEAGQATTTMAAAAAADPSIQPFHLHHPHRVAVDNAPDDVPPEVQGIPSPAPREPRPWKSPSPRLARSA